MGVKNINALIKKHSPDAFFNIPIDSFSGKRIAIDGNNWAFVNMANARKRVVRRTDISQQRPDQLEIRREWLLSLTNFVIGWLSYGVTPVFVFDGEHPVEKDQTKAKRKENKVSAKTRIEELYKQLENIDLEFPGNILEQLQKELCNYNYIPTEDFELLKIIIKGIGVPCLQAEGDGEKLCSALCVEGKVAAVFSTDTDNLVYGCPLVITGYSDQYSYDEYNQKVQNVDCVRIDRVLSGLKISHQSFVDLCIMSGCDYNTNMPGCASVKSFALLQKHGSIDNLCNLMDVSCLNYKRCRELFKLCESSKLTGDPLFLNIDKTCLATCRDYLEMGGIAGQVNRLVSVYSNAPDAKDGTLEKLNLTTPKRVIDEVQTNLIRLVIFE